MHRPMLHTARNLKAKVVKDSLFHRTVSSPQIIILAEGDQITMSGRREVVTPVAGGKTRLSSKSNCTCQSFAQLRREVGFCFGRRETGVPAGTKWRERECNTHNLCEKKKVTQVAVPNAVH